MIITIKERTFDVITKFNDLTADQLLKIMRIVHGRQPANIAYLRMLKIMASVPDSFWNTCQVLDVEQFMYLSQELLKDRLTKQLLPMQKRFAGPADNFNNLQMGEFVFTEDYFFAFKEDSNIKHLDNLCAVLFRPVKKNYDRKVNPDGDVRIPFNQNRCLYNAKTAIRKWKLEIKLAILTWYEHCRLQLVDDFPAVFAGGSGDPAKYGLITMMRNVAQSGTHGNFDNVEILPLKMVMIELDEMLMEAEQIKKIKPAH
jgi:hypothetical protein